MSFTNLPPFIWQFAAETDGKRGQGAEVSPRESNRGHNHTTCIINHMVTSLSSSCSPLSLLLLLSPPPPPLSLLSTSHCLLLGAVWSLEACHQRCMLGKYYHRSFWQIDKRYEYPWGTFICDIFSKPQHTELKHTFTVLCMHTCINIYTHSHTHTHTHSAGCLPTPCFRKHNMDARNSLPTKWRTSSSQQSSVWLSAWWLTQKEVRRAFRWAFVFTQTIRSLKIAPSLHL